MTPGRGLEAQGALGRGKRARGAGGTCAGRVGGSETFLAPLLSSNANPSHSHPLSSQVPRGSVPSGLAPGKASTSHWMEMQGTSKCPLGATHMSQPTALMGERGSLPWPVPSLPSAGGSGQGPSTLLSSLPHSLPSCPFAFSLLPTSKGSPACIWGSLTGGGEGCRCLKFPAKLKMLKISPTTRLPPSGGSFMILDLYLQSLKS